MIKIRVASFFCLDYDYWLIMKTMRTKERKNWLFFVDEGDFHNFFFKHRHNMLTWIYLDYHRFFFSILDQLRSYICKSNESLFSIIIIMIINWDNYKIFEWISFHYKWYILFHFILFFLINPNEAILMLISTYNKIYARTNTYYI